MKTKITLFLALFTVSSAFSTMDIADVTLGFNNGYKSGKWAPLNVIVRSQNEPNPFIGELTVEVRNTLDKPIYRYAVPLQMSPTDQKNKRLYIYCPKTAKKLLIQIVPSENAAYRIEQNETRLGQSATHTTQEITPPIPIKNKDYFVLVLTPSGDKMRKFIDKKQLNEDDTHAHIRYLPNPNAMPTQWIGYSAVDLMVIREVPLTDRRTSKSQQAALLNWVLQGGTLVVSGGSNFRYLKSSFIEPFLPVTLVREETIDKVPRTLQQKFDLQISPIDKGYLEGYAFKNIHFAPKPECTTLLGTDEQIYIAKRNFGSGQIIALAFDYNVPPFSDQKAGEAFWRWLLKTHGKSPKRLADRYAPFREHEAKIHQQFLSKMPTQIPLIKFLAIVLPIYLLSCGGFLRYIGRGKNSPKKRIRGYWIIGFMFVLIAVSMIGVARAVLPKKIETDRLSILSIYPEQKNAHLQTYMSLRATARTQKSIPLTPNTFIRPLMPDLTVKAPQFSQGTPFQVQKVSIQPWSPSTYVQEAFLSLDTQPFQVKLENAWRIMGEQATYLGTTTLGSSNLWASESPGKTVNKVPFQEVTQTGKFMLHGLEGARKTFAKTLQQEGLLQYLLKPENTLTKNKTLNRPILMGWTSQMEQILTNIPITSADENVISDDETLIIMSFNEMDTGM